MLKIIIIVAIALIAIYAVSAKSDMKLKVGDKAPDFTLQDAFGKSYTLSDYKGKSPVIVYFYPKASTPGCTKEACGIRDDWSKFKENNIPVLGISVDDKPAIKKFVDDYKLNFPLLSDADKKVSKEYDVVGILGFDKRVTFIVDKNSKIADIIEVKDIANHSKMVLDKALTLK
ncbi:MAG: peroxiredoxin [Ignavibacteriaceae bacterium]|nr:peroxiredoxin [Ignavibacteriaceae bacterium]